MEWTDDPIETHFSLFPLPVGHVAVPHQQHVMVDGCISPIPCIVVEIKEKDLVEPFGRNVKSMRILFFLKTTAQNVRGPFWYKNRIPMDVLSWCGCNGCREDRLSRNRKRMFGKANSLVTLPLGVVVFAWFGYRVGNGRMQVIFAPLVKLGNYIEGDHTCVPHYQLKITG